MSHPEFRHSAFRGLESGTFGARNLGGKYSP